MYMLTTDQDILRIAFKQVISPAILMDRVRARKHPYHSAPTRQRIHCIRQLPIYRGLEKEAVLVQLALQESCGNGGCSGWARSASEGTGERPRQKSETDCHASHLGSYDSAIEGVGGHI
jgi:hypothetical protein